MDLVTSCKDKLAYFRIKELKDVLTSLGLSKQGKKQDLVDRILAVITDEQVSSIWAKKNAVGKEDVSKLVDDIYRKMQGSAATDLASKGQGASDSSNAKPKEEIEEPINYDKIRCPCGSCLRRDSMIMCEDRRCHVWQHIGCVIIAEKPVDCLIPATPEIFYCDLCRLSRADPFWVTMANLVYPTLLTTTPNGAIDGQNITLSLEKTFHLTRMDKDLLLKQDYDLQAWCILLNDKVIFRMQWPQHAELQVNGIPMRTINRPGSQLLGANGRDDGPVITPCTREGLNKISLTGCDTRVFCFGVRIVKRRTVQQILKLIPKESDGERFEDSLARVLRYFGGGTATENADSDSELEVVADSVTVNLRCPMSGLRMKIAGKFKPCAHMGCFDLEVFVEMNQRSRKWQCPICLKNYSLENIIIDPYFNLIASKMTDSEEDVTDIEVKPDGSWRAKADDHRDLGPIGQWHLPDGTICISAYLEVETNSEAIKQIKQEGLSEGHMGLKLGIKKNRNGFWEVSKPEDTHTLSSGDGNQGSFKNQIGQNVIPMSSSATGSGKDGEDPSVNQDGGENFDFSANNGIELDSISLRTDPTYRLCNGNPSAPSGPAEVIVLSDSEEENDPLISSRTIYKDDCNDADGITYLVPPHEISSTHPEDPSLRTEGNSSLGLFNSKGDEYGMPIWSLPSASQAGPGFQLFGADMGVSGALDDLEPGSINCSTAINGYSLTTETAMGSAALVPDSSVGPSNVNMSDRLVDNPLAFGGNDPSLQIFLPTGPADSSMQPNKGSQPDVSNAFHSEDWISLSLGGGGNGSHGDSAGTSGLNSRQQLPSQEGGVSPVATTDSLLLGMNGSRSSKTSRGRTDSPFSFPRQPRSVRPRVYFSVESDSE